MQNASSFFESVRKTMSIYLFRILERQQTTVLLSLVIIQSYYYIGLSICLEQYNNRDYASHANNSCNT